jgi:serine/threonine protein kinase
LPDFSTLDLSLVKTHYQYFYHLAPEVSRFVDYTELSDIYACGVTFYRLINGDSYLPSIDPVNISKYIKEGKYPDRTNYRDFIPKSLRVFTNKAMNPDVTKRFQSAAEMRHSLEQIKLINNWNESVTPNGMYWSMSTKTGILIVEKMQNAGLWTVETKKGKAKTSLKRISELCLYNVSKSKADSLTKKILQKAVQGQ